MECPKCGLINPETAQICDCGYNFETRAKGKPIITTPAWGDALGLPAGGEVKLTSLGKRLAGQIIDAIIALILAVCTFIPFHFIGENENAQITIFLIMYLGYLLFSDGFKGGQSLGKKIMKTAVIDASDGKPCTYLQSFRRNILQILGIIDWIFIFGKKRQRLGDIAAGTIVVRIS